MLSAFSNVTWIVLGILLLGGVALIAGLFFVFRQDGDVEKRVDRFVGSTQQSAPQRDFSARSALTSFREILNTFSNFLYSEVVFRKLSGANWQITVAEYFLIRYLGAIVVFVIASIFSGILITGALLSFGFFILPEMLLNRAIEQRRNAFQEQLIDVLVLMIGSIRAGHSLIQSIDVIVQEMPPPASEEFNRVKREVELGVPITQALLNFSRRMENEDVDIVITAININTRVGGNLTVMMSEVVETIRERSRLLGEVRSLTSYARYTSYLLTSLPVLAAGILYLLSPGYFNAMLTHPSRFLLIAVPVVMVAIGNFWIQRIANFKA
jgi:tight adherence protein B